MEKISIVLNIQNIKQSRTTRRTEEEKVNYNEFTGSICPLRLLLREHSSRPLHLWSISSKGTLPKPPSLKHLTALTWNFFASG